MRKTRHIFHDKRVFFERDKNSKFKFSITQGMYSKKKNLKEGGANVQKYNFFKLKKRKFSKIWPHLPPSSSVHGTRPTRVAHVTD